MHPSTAALLRYFKHDHLAPKQAIIVEGYALLANGLVEALPPGPETTVALRKLLESKDAAVRASLDLPDQP